MNELSLFAGVGGGLLGSKLLGWQTICAVEKEPYCREVLLRRQWDGVLDLFPIWDDIKTFSGIPWRGKVDIVTAGFPCQPFSSASRGRKTAVDLWPEALRVISEVEPANVFAENVKPEPIEQARRDLKLLGYVAQPGRVSAAAVGAPARRIRYWLVAHANNERQCVSSVNDEAPRKQTAKAAMWEQPPERELLRVASGDANRMDRIRAIGNGQIPSVVVAAWNLLKGTK